MDVAVVSCQECFFSKEAEALIRTFFDKLVTADKQKLDVAYVFDIHYWTEFRILLWMNY